MEFYCYKQGYPSHKFDESVIERIRERNYLHNYLNDEDEPSTLTREKKNLKVSLQSIQGKGSQQEACMSNSSNYYLYIYKYAYKYTHKKTKFIKLSVHHCTIIIKNNREALRTRNT